MIKKFSIFLIAVFVLGGILVTPVFAEPIQSGTNIDLENNNPPGSDSPGTGTKNTGTDTETGNGL